MLYVLPSGSTLRGGARSNLLLMEHLSRFQPHVLTLKGSGMADECRRRGISVHEADADAASDLNGRVWRGQRWAAYRALVHRGRAIAHRLRPAIVQSDYEHFPIAFGICCGCRLRSVLYVRGWLVHGVHTRALVKFLAADAIVVLTDAIRREIISGSPALLRQRLASKVRVVHNSVASPWPPQTQ